MAVVDPDSRGVAKTASKPVFNPFATVSNAVNYGTKPGPPQFNPAPAMTRAVTSLSAKPIAPAPKATAPAPVRSAAPARAAAPTSFDGGGGGSFDGVNAVAAAPVAPTPVMETISVPDPKADTSYQKTVADIARSMADFQAQQNLQRSQYDTQYGDAKRRMGWRDDLNRFDAATPGAYHDAIDTNTNDFGGRGMFYSGAYGAAQGDINRDFGDRKTSLDTARNDNVNTAQQAFNAYKGQEDAIQQAALTDAVARIAQQLGISQDQVTPGAANQITRQKV